MRKPTLSVLLIASLAIASHGQESQPRTVIDAAKAGPDFHVQGEYLGRMGPDAFAGAQVIALGGGKFDAVLFAKGLPGGGWDGKTKILLHGETRDGKAVFSGTNFEGVCSRGEFAGSLDGVTMALRRIERRSPTMGAKPPPGAVVLFDGSSVDEWAGGRLVEGNLLAVGTRTKRVFRNYRLHLEFRTPYMPFDRGQARGNSGMYCNDQYEFQILDSFGLAGENNECGGYYSFARPLLNMCLPPLAWQTYDVDFEMAQYDANGNKARPARATVRLNGVVIHDNYEIPRFNGGGGLADESKPGAIYLQDHGNPVHFRNIWIQERN
jgi:hypothetical protein